MSQSTLFQSSGQVFLGLTSTKQGINCLAEGHKAVALVRFEPATPQSRVKHSTTEPPRSSTKLTVNLALSVCSIGECALVRLNNVNQK